MINSNRFYFFVVHQKNYLLTTLFLKKFLDSLSGVIDTEKKKLLTVPFSLESAGKKSKTL